jgi:hypothetical protein
MSDYDDDFMADDEDYDLEYSEDSNSGKQSFSITVFRNRNLDTKSDPAFYLDADPDRKSKINADPELCR